MNPVRLRNNLLEPAELALTLRDGHSGVQAADFNVRWFGHVILTASGCRGELVPLTDAAESKRKPEQ